jgi:hypothetical protein
MWRPRPALARSTCAASLVAAVFGLGAGCNGPSDGNTVTIDRNDPSPPEVALDLYNIPLQPGASSQPQPESVNAGCCDVTRLVGRAGVSAVAGTIEDGGAKSIGIWVELTRSCTNPDGTVTTTGPGLIGGPTAENRDQRQNPTTGARNLVVTYDLGQHFQRCAGQVRVWAEGENFAGGRTRTKVFTLRFG